MKKKALVWGAVFLAVVPGGIASHAADTETYGFYRPQYNEVIYGTWVNEDINADRPEKLVYTDWGGWEGYVNAADKIPAFKGTAILVDKWTDSQGCTWYKEYWRAAGHISGFFCLDRISRDGKALECVEDVIMWPAEEDLISKSYRYTMYHRR
jgi:hypothetical protein